MTEDAGFRLQRPALARFFGAWERHLGPRETPAPGALPGLRQQIAAWIDGVEDQIVAGT